MTPYEARAQAAECRDRMRHTSSQSIIETLDRCARHFDDLAERAEADKERAAERRKGHSSRFARALLGRSIEE
ncbi:hypothetical protein [Albimonas pacifica]|uniref:Uncharacterized protein n=1 Tax=Albimonas pacifica TaxID=1114924 RepID=A0A1I3HJW3_9RHOB|nr:hypothetical protein [Albimonas pacifica]SFI36026.1 hypothetical protein SAMN05216258_10638 [Albimonas pacifica]